MNNCSIENCKGVYYAKGYCRSHYRKLTGQHKKQWLSIKARPKYRRRLREKQRLWARSHKRNYRIHSDKIYFGGLREITIKRDKEKCVDCGLTRKQHIRKWGKDLHVNHIDHTKVNFLDNLETLCVRCHASKSHY